MRLFKSRPASMPLPLRPLFWILMLWIQIVPAPPAVAQDNLRMQLFGEADTLLARIKADNANLFAPASYERGMGYYKDADEDFKKGGSLERMREDLGNASVYFAKTLDVAKVGQAALSGAMAARTDAISAGAPAHSTELFNKGEEKFKRAALDIERGDLGSGNKNGAEAADHFRTAELEAIKTNFLGPARDLLKKADQMGVEENAPKTLSRAQQLVAQTEDLLRQNRYDTDSARYLAQEAKYEAAHAIFLHQVVERIKQSDGNFEQHILNVESHFGKLSNALGHRARFDEGLEKPTNEALTAIKKLEAKGEEHLDALTAAATSLRAKESDVANMRQQIASMEQRVGSLTQTEKDLQTRLAVHQTQEATIGDVEAMFAKSEARVLREGGKIIIRLYGLSFSTGRNTIEPAYYNVMTKVQDAIRKFPNSSVVIEGHTDSFGSDESNQSLSESRSKSVAEYLMANMGVERAINSVGYGESRPLATNDTPEGRSKNRRIDVIINPNW